MEGVHRPQAMEGGLHQGRHLHLEDMVDNLPAPHRHLEDMEDSLPGLRQHLEAIDLHLEVMELTPCRLEICHSRDRKPH